MMKQVAPTADQAIQTNPAEVHKMRSPLFNTSASLSSVDSHPSDCMPDEAVLTVSLLLMNNGKATQSNLPARDNSPPRGYVAVTSTTRNARSDLNAYLLSHSPREDIALYELLNHTLGFWGGVS
jgi:hypothetical protein